MTKRPELQTVTILIYLYRCVENRL